MTGLIGKEIAGAFLGEPRNLFHLSKFEEEHFGAFCPGQNGYFVFVRESQPVALGQRFAIDRS